MALTPDQVDDIVNLTLPEFKRHKWTDLSLEHQEYISATLIDQKRVVEDGGPHIEFKIKTKNTGNARNTKGLFAVDETAVEDVTTKGTVPWAKQTTNWSYDVDEDLFQSDRETIVRLLALREHDALSDLAELDEQNLWTAPTKPDDPRPMGVPFWLQKDASAAPTGGFNGGNPAGFTLGCANVSSTTYPRWRNWSFLYSAVTVDDLIARIKKAIAFTYFQAPVPHPELGFGKSDYTIFTTYRVAEPMERLAESRNDNLGRDLARYVNIVTVAGVPVRWVPYLETNDTSDPLYGINWKTFRPFVKRGCHMRRSPPKQSARQHTVREVHIDNWMNYICYNRRYNFVGSKA